MVVCVVVVMDVEIGIKKMCEGIKEVVNENLLML